MSNTLPQGQIIIPNARLSFPKLFKAEAVKGDPNAKPRYGCQILLPKSDKETRKKIEAEMDLLVKTKLDGVKPKAKDLFIKDGDGEDGDELTKGYWVISANRSESQGRPQVIDRSKKAIDSSESAKVYGGCQCNFLIGLYVPKQWKKLCASLEIVQFVRDDEPFGSGPADTSVMPELEDLDDEP